MEQNNNLYNSPWSERYSSEEMLYNFSNNNKYQTWRKLWIALAEAQNQLGLPITLAQIEELKDHKDDINYKQVMIYEKELQHDVMAHIKSYGDVAPNAKGIIHLGVTSAFVTDNTDLIQIKSALELTKKRLLQTIHSLTLFASKHKNIPTLGFTHFQAAQLTTVGKRATLWIQSFLIDLRSLEYVYNSLPFRGIKGAVGTGSGLADLFNNNYDKFKTLDKILAEKFGFSKSIEVSGQTYDRKIDSQVAHLLNQIAQSAHKLTNDLRLLQHLKEIEEDFSEKQVGSSAMAYKKNPILSERVSSLAKFVLSLSTSPELVASTQWFERTLDDSANKRICTPQLFLATDAILLLCKKIVSHLKVYPHIIAKHVNHELPFIATESLLMESVKRGFNRQTIHEIIRTHSVTTSTAINETGSENDLLKRLALDPNFPLSNREINDIVSSNNYTGFAVEQTEDFLTQIIDPILKKHHDLL